MFISDEVFFEWCYNWSNGMFLRGEVGILKFEYNCLMGDNLKWYLWCKLKINFEVIKLYYERNLG